MQPSDPYSEIKQEVENELLHATHLRSNLFAGNSANAAAKQLAYQLQNVTEQLSALEAAVKRMIDHPERFQLDAGSAYARQLEVEKLRWQLQDLQATCAHVEISTNKNSFKELSQFGEVEMNRGKSNKVVLVVLCMVLETFRHLQAAAVIAVGSYWSRCVSLMRL